MFSIVPLANAIQISNIDRAMLSLTYAKLSRVEDRNKPSFAFSCLFNMSDLPFLKFVTFAY